MQMLLRTSRLITIAMLLVATSLWAQQAARPSGPGVVELRRALDQAYADEDWFAYLDAARKLHLLRPNNGQYMYHVVVGNALVGDLSGAYTMMLTMQRQGLSYDFDATPDTIPIRRTEAYGHINELLKIQGEPMGEVRTWHTFGPEVKTPSSLAWDPSRGAMLLGTVRDGVVFAVTPGGGTRELLRADENNGLWGIHGLLVDAERQRLFVASAADQRFSGFDAVDTGRSALFEFDLATLELIRRIPVPVDGRPHRLGQMVQGPEGNIYVADGIIPIVYTLPAGQDRLRLFFIAQELINLRGLALSPDGRWLYFADYEMGIGVLDTEQEQAYTLQVPETLNVGGIEGLVLHGDYLVAIQNGNRPQRIMRLTLGENPWTVTDVAPMAVSAPQFDFPSYGVMLGDDIVFIADSRPEADEERVILGSSSVTEVSVLTTPDIEKFKRDMQRQNPDFKLPGEQPDEE